MKFKGFDDWIEIFRGGKQTDSDGVEHDGDSLIDKAVDTFDTSYHEPPLVIGHPRHDDPAYGWVEGLKKTVKDGVNILHARFKDVVPEFIDAAKSGLYKKRSVRFYPDGRLRHVGVLGAAPPAVKGLANVAFSDDDPGIGFETDEDEKESNIMKFSEFLEAFKFWKKMEADPDADVSVITTGAAPGPKTFTEADIEAAKKEATAEERKKAADELAKKQRQGAQEAQNKEISDFCDALVSEKKMPPSWVDSGLVTFMQGLDGEKEISFAEGGDKKSSLQWYKDHLNSLGESPIFKEMATKEAAGKGSEFAEAEKDKETGESIAAKVN